MVIRSLSCAALFALGLTTYAGQTEWPEFRGPTAQGYSEATNVPTEWNANLNVAWKVPVPGTGWSSPVLSGGKIFLTSAVQGGTETTLHALCYDAATGKQLWDKEVIKPDAGAIAAMHRKNSPASPTAIVKDGKVYVHFGHMGTAALDTNGRVLWTQTSLPYPPTHGNGGSPALVNGLLIFSADGGDTPSVIALDAATGQLKWKTERHTPAKKTFSFSTPLAIELGGKTQVISPGSGFVGAYDPADGKELWRVNYGEGYSVIPRPVYQHGLLFLSSGYDRPSVYAIRPEGAKGDATATNIAWTFGKGSPNTPSLIVVGDEVYFVSDGGIATCADAKTGKVHWTERLGGNFSASPVLAEGRLYFLNESGVCYVLKPGTTYQPLAKNELGERTLASPAVADGALYLRSEANLWKIGGK